MNKIEAWKSYPEFPFIEGSSLGRVRTRDRVVRNGRGKRIVRGRILKQCFNGAGYLQVHFGVNGRPVTQLVHRIIAECLIPNPDNLPQVNHKDCDRTNNNVSNLEWCDASYNQRYREKYGVSNAESQGFPVFAVDLTTLEVFRFPARAEAGRKLGVSDTGVDMVIKGKYNQMNGYWFTDADENAIEAVRSKLDKFGSVMVKKASGRPIFAVNLTTLEVSRFPSQTEAGRALGVDPSSVTKVTKGKLKTAGGYWFTNTDSNAVEATKNKFGDIVADKVEKATRNKLGDIVVDKIEELMTDKEMQPA